MDEKQERFMSDKYGKEAGILAEFMDDMVGNASMKEQTVYNYYMTCRTLAKFIKKQRANLPCALDEVVMKDVKISELASLTRDEYDDYLDYYAFQCRETRGSQAVRISCITKLYRWMEAKHGVEFPAFIAEVKRPSVKADIHEFTFVTPEAEKRLCEHLRGADRLVIRNACIIRLLLHCGIGLDEISEMTMSSLYVKAIAIGSEPENRLIQLDDETDYALNQYLKVRLAPTDGKNTLFVSEKKGQLTRSSIEKMLRKALKNANMLPTVISVRDLQMTSRQRMIQQLGIDEAARLSRVTSKRHYKMRYTRVMGNPGPLAVE